MRRRDFIKMAGSASARGEENIAIKKKPPLSRGRRFLILFAGAALGFSAIGTILAYVIDAPDLLRLLYRHAETGGKVTRHIPDSHGMVEIGYSIGGTPYRRAVPRFGAGLSWVVGDAVPVYYDPDDPAVAFTAPAAEILEAERPAWIGASMLGSVFGIVLALRILRIRE